MADTTPEKQTTEQQIMAILQTLPPDYVEMVLTFVTTAKKQHKQQMLHAELVIENTLQHSFQSVIDESPEQLELPFMLSIKFQKFLDLLPPNLLNKELET